MSAETSYSKRHPRLLAFSILMGFAIVFVGLIAAYVWKFEQQLSAENRVRLEEVSRFVAAHMTTVVTDTRETLKTVAVAVARLDSAAERMTYLEAVAERHGFAYLGWAGPDGRLQATMPSQTTNVSGEPYFREALNGKAVVSGLVRKIFANRAVSGILFAVPMPQGTRQGVLAAMLETERLREALNLESFGGHGYSYIIERSGDVVMRTRSLDFSNLFRAWECMAFRKGTNLVQFRADVEAGREGMLVFRNLVGSVQYAAYRSLPFNNWMMVNVVSEQAVSGETVRLTRELALLGGLTAFIFMGLMYWAMRSHRLSQESRLAAEAKSAFLANMSHEIRTPMNAIVGLSEILLREEQAPRHREQLMCILNSGRGLLTVINDILDYSRIESGRFSIAEEPYELDSLLSELALIAAIRIGDKPVQFLVETDPGLPRSLKGDPSRVKQVLLNLLSNAIKFTERGVVRLIARAERNGKGWLLHVEVRDTGIGIREEDLDKLFIRFTRVDTRRNRNVEGTGLGLTICRKLCEMMGGRIEISSRYGEGSSFRIVISQGIGGAESLLPPLPGGLALLVCEETPLLREYEAACLDKLGLRHVLCATSGEFEAGLRTGSFSHAMARRSVLQAIDPAAAGRTQLLGLLALNEHSFMYGEATDIYLPLFPIQLSHALSGASPSFLAAARYGGEAHVPLMLPQVSVLIVDDNELNLEIAEGLLEPCGMHTERARSGREAVEAVQKREYDLVLMDHMMPEMDGVEALRLIRDLPHEKFRLLPIVALTANTTAEARRMFLDNGFNGFLAKPIDTEKLNQILAQWLKPISERRTACGDLESRDTPVSGNAGAASA